MKAVGITQTEGQWKLRHYIISDPEIGPDEVLIKVVAAGVNRRDLLVNRPDLSPLVLGIECSGYIARVGTSVTHLSIGDPVCALLENGGYAEMVAVSAEQVLSVPETFPLVDCAGLPELAYTSWLALFSYGSVRQGDVIMIHEGCGEIGMLATMMAMDKGVKVYLAADTKEKVEMWKALGVSMVIDKNEGFTSQVMNATGGRGIDVILVDEATNLDQNLKILAQRGAVVVIPLRGDTIAKVYLPHLIAKNCKVKVLDRIRMSINPKSAVKEIEDNVWRAITTCPCRPVFNFPKYSLSVASTAHMYMEAVPDCWKLIFTVTEASQNIPETTPCRSVALAVRRRMTFITD